MTIAYVICGVLGIATVILIIVMFLYVVPCKAKPSFLKSPLEERWEKESIMREGMEYVGRRAKVSINSGLYEDWNGYGVGMFRSWGRGYDFGYIEFPYTIYWKLSDGKKEKLRDYNEKTCVSIETKEDVEFVS